MENWLKSLSIRELKTWIKNCGNDLYPLIDRPNQENIKLAKEILEFYAPLSGRLGLELIKKEMNDLAFKIQNPKKYKEIVKFLKMSKGKREKFIKEIGKDENYNIINNIYIMPLWRDSKSQINSLVLKYCLNKWYNYCLRQHLILFWDWKWK